MWIASGSSTTEGGTEMLSFSFLLTCIGLALALVDLFLSFHPRFGGPRATALTTAAVVCIAVALIIGGVGVWYVHFGTVH